jgi:hypothetical protein
MKMTDLTRGKQFADTFSKFVNSSLTPDVDEAVQAMLCDHRTLQQSMMGLFMKFAEEMSKSEHCDMRNQASVKLAKSIMKLDESVRVLPSI